MVKPHLPKDGHRGVDVGTTTIICVKSDLLLDSGGLETLRRI